MSPEQARGAPVDKRTDVWAFGCVLFEMLAGRHVFGGAGTVSDAIAAVLKSEPDWHALPANTPPHIRSLLKRCLEKDPRRRLRDIGDAGLLLGDDPHKSDATSPEWQATMPSTGASRWTRWAAVAGWTVAVVLAIVNAVWIAGGFRAEPPLPAAPLRLALPLASQLMPGDLTRPSPSRATARALSTWVATAPGRPSTCRISRAESSSDCPKQPTQMRRHSHLMDAPSVSDPDRQSKSCLLMVGCRATSRG